MDINEMFYWKPDEDVVYQEATGFDRSRPLELGMFECAICGYRGELPKEPGESVTCECKLFTLTCPSPAHSGRAIK